MWAAAAVRFSGVQPADRAVVAVQTASPPLGSLPRRAPASGLVSYYRSGAGGQLRDGLMKSKRALCVLELTAAIRGRWTRNQTARSPFQFILYINFHTSSIKVVLFFFFSLKGILINCFRCIVYHTFPRSLSNKIPVGTIDSESVSPNAYQRCTHPAGNGVR